MPTPPWLEPALHSAYTRYANKLAGIKMLVMDVDGVLTDGRITYTTSGEELKTFNVKDGQGLSLLSTVGIKTAIITARQSVVVERRAAELGITAVYQNAKPKLPALEQLMNTYRITPEQVAYMGDDWPDCAILQAVGFATCPVDAIMAVQTQCHWICPYPGGQGAMRALCDLLLAAHGFNP